MAYTSPTAPPPPASRTTSINRILVLALHEELVSLLCSRIQQNTPLEPLCVRPDPASNRDTSPTSPPGAPSSRTPQLSASSSALSSPEYVARLIRSANVTTVLLDLRDHPNELGLSCGFLTALKSIGFKGHVVYVSISGDLLKPSTDSRSLRETYPVHAAVEVQLQNTGRTNSQTGFMWTVLGRSTHPLDSATQSPVSPPTEATGSFKDQAPGWREASDFRRGTTTSTSSSSPANGLPWSPPLELAEGIIRTIRTHGRLLHGRKIMLDTIDGRRRSFMHQTDWKPDD